MPKYNTDMLFWEIMLTSENTRQDPLLRKQERLEVHLMNALNYVFFMIHNIIFFSKY